MSYLVEVCLDSVESAVAAAKGGADRVELCDNLFEGGTTPSAGSIKMARKLIDIGLQVIIRPRGGDFCYSEIEFETMKADIQMAKDLGADGVVIGILNPDGSVDKARNKELIDLARPMNVTFHRAFDMSRDPFEALEDIIEIGADRILTSGQEASVPEGLELIAELIEKAGERIIIMPGAGITERNLEKVLKVSKAKEIHIYTPRQEESRMEYRPDHIYMGGYLHLPEFAVSRTCSSRVNSMISKG